MEPSNATNKSGEGYRLNEGKIWFNKGQLAMESTNKNANRGHHTVQHPIKASPMTKREIKEKKKMRKIERKIFFPQISHNKDAEDDNNDEDGKNIETESNTQRNYTTETNFDKKGSQVATKTKSTGIRQRTHT